MSKKSYSHYPGWLILNKPIGISSAKAVNVVKRFFNVKKAGHAGTLDPLASGVLPIALDEATKTIPYLVDTKKRYKFSVSWGQQTDTDDSEGDIINESNVYPGIDQIENILSSFIGQVTQIPPRYSAIKIKGKRAYSLARENKSFEMPSRTIRVLDLRVTRELKTDLTEVYLLLKKLGFNRILVESGLKYINEILKYNLIKNFFLFKSYFPLKNNGMNNAELNLIKKLKTTIKNKVQINLNNDSLHKIEL